MLVSSIHQKYLKHSNNKCQTTNSSVFMSDESLLVRILIFFLSITPMFVNFFIFKPIRWWCWNFIRKNYLQVDNGRHSRFEFISNLAFFTQFWSVSTKNKTSTNVQSTLILWKSWTLCLWSFLDKRHRLYLSTSSSALIHFL